MTAKNDIMGDLIKSRLTSNARACILNARKLGKTELIQEAISRAMEMSVLNIEHDVIYGTGLTSPVGLLATQEVMSYGRGGEKSKTIG